MKKVLALILMVFAVQGSLLLCNNGSLSDIAAAWWYGYDNLERYAQDSQITKKCIETSKPWNYLYNALTINNRSDVLACEDLNAEFVKFQQKFLEEVRDKKMVTKKEFYAKYFNDNSAKHEHKISAVFDPVDKKSDFKVRIALGAYQSALKKSTEDL